MHTVLGNPQDNGIEPQKELRLLSETLFNAAESLFTDENIITENNTTLLNENASIITTLKKISALVDINQFQFTDFGDLFEDLAIIEEVLQQDIESYGHGFANLESIREGLQELFNNIRVGFLGSPQRLLMEEEERVQQEMAERVGKESQIEKNKRELKKYSISLVSLFGRILDSADMNTELLNGLKTENIIEHLSTSDLENNWKNIMTILEDRVLELMSFIEDNSKDSHIFKNHGDSLSIEEMNKVLEVKGRNSNRNRNFQSKFDDNIFIARAIIRNIFEINEAVAKLEAKFMERSDGNIDHRGRPNLINEVSTVFARFEQDIGTVYQTNTYDDGTCLVNEESASKTRTVFIGFKMYNKFQTVEGQISSRIKFSIETMYPVRI